ncbi:MAG: exosortase [Pseudomonadota bacterium]
MLHSRQLEPLDSRVMVAAVAVLFAVAVWLTRGAWQGLWELWQYVSGYTHGPLVILVSGYLLYERRECLRAVAPSWIGLLGVLGISCGLAVAAIVNMRILEMALLPALLIALVLAIWGWRSILPIGAALAYLYFAVPVWAIFTPVLQSMTIDVVSLALDAFGIPANVEATLVHIPAGTFEIAAGCAGTRYFIVALALATFVSMLSPLSIGRKFALVGLAAMLAVVGNWIRVFVIILVGHQSDMQHSLIVDGHNNFGWLVYAVVMIPVGIIAWRVLRQPDSPTAESARSPVNTGLKPFVIASATALVAMLGPVAYANHLDAEARDSQLRLSVEWPPESGRWRLTSESHQWQPNFVGADDVQWRHFESQWGSAVGFVAAYRYQDQGREPDFVDNEAFPAETVIMSTDIVADQSGDLIRRSLASGSGSSSVSYLRYVSGSDIIASQLKFKLATLLHALQGDHAALAVGVWVDCNHDCQFEDKDVFELTESIVWTVETGALQ